MLCNSHATIRIRSKNNNRLIITIQYTRNVIYHLSLQVLDLKEKQKVCQGHWVVMICIGLHFFQSILRCILLYPGRICKINNVLERFITQIHSTNINQKMVSIPIGCFTYIFSRISTIYTTNIQGYKSEIRYCFQAR